MTPDELSESISVSPVPETVLLQVTVTDPSPERAQLLADTVGREFQELVDGLETPPNSPPVAVTVVEAGRLATDPIGPNIARNLSLGALSGLLVGLGVAVLRARRMDTQP